jgi:hypothetical protein
MVKVIILIMQNGFYCYTIRSYTSTYKNATEREKKKFFFCGLQKILRDRPFALRKVGHIRWIQLFLIIV